MEESQIMTPDIFIIFWTKTMKSQGYNEKIIIITIIINIVVVTSAVIIITSIILPNV